MKSSRFNVQLKIIFILVGSIQGRVGKNSFKNNDWKTKTCMFENEWILKCQIIVMNGVSIKFT